MQFNLAQAVRDKINALGTKEAAVYFGTTEKTAQTWLKSPPYIGAAQKVLDEWMREFQLGQAKVEDFPDENFEDPSELARMAKEEAEIPFTEAERIAKAEEASERMLEEMGGAGDMVVATINKLTGIVEVIEPPEEPEQKRPVQPSKRFSILLPTHRDYVPVTVLSVLGNWKATVPEGLRKDLAAVDMEQDTVIHRARNILAARFLQSGNEWSFWMDSDMVCSIGNPAWFKRKTGSKQPDKYLTVSAIEKLTSRGKSFIGGVYANRSLGGKPCNSIGRGTDSLKQVSAEEMKEVQDKVIQLDSTGFGCVAVSRQVFLDILEKVPCVKTEVEGEPPGFFNHNGPEGEDHSFAMRAKQAGHPCFLDLSVHCSHVGRYAFNP